MKSVQTRSFSGPYFPTFGLNTGRYGVSLRILSECGKIRTRKNSIFWHFSRSVTVHFHLCLNVNLEKNNWWFFVIIFAVYLAKVSLLKLNNRKTRKRCEICTKLTIKTPKRRHWRRSSDFVVNIWTYFTHFSSFSIVNFEQVNICYLATLSKVCFRKWSGERSWSHTNG